MTLLKGMSRANPASARLLTALNKAALDLQQASLSEDDVIRAFSSSVDSLGLRGGYSILDPDTNQLRFQRLFKKQAVDRINALMEKTTGLDPDNFSIPVDQVDLYRKIIQNKKGVFVEDSRQVASAMVPDNAPDINRKIFELIGPTPGIFVPRRDNGSVVGTLYLIGGNLTKEDIPAVQVFADQFSIALKNAALFQRLMESELKYRDLVDNSQDLICTHSLDGTILSVNPAVTSLLGYEREEILQMKIQDILVPKYRHMYSSYQEQIQTDGIAAGRFAVLTKEGDQRTWEYSNSLRDVPGSELVIRGLARDVTEQLRAEQALAESEQRYRRISELITDFVYGCRVTDKTDLSLEWIEGRFYKITGYNREELHQLGSLLSFVHPDDKGKFDQRQDQLLAGEVATYEYRIHTKTGEVRWLRDHSSPVVNERSGKVERIYGAVEDITDQIVVEENYLGSESRYRGIFEGVRDAIFVETPQGEILDVNQAACQMYGYTREEFLTKTARDLVPEDQTILISSEGGIPSHPVETINLKADGSPFPVEISGQVQSLNGDTVMLIVVRDISERKRSEAAQTRQLRELTVLHKVASLAIDSQTEDDLIEEFTHIIGEVFYSDNFGILLADEMGENLLVSPSYRGISDESKQIILPLTHDSITTWVAQHGEPYRVTDTRKDERYFEANPGMQSELCVPIKLGEKILGVVNAESSQLDAFSAEDERLLTTLAGQLATAIERLRKERSEFDQRIFAEALQDTALSLNRSLEVDQILDQVLSNINKVVAADGINIMLLENELISTVRYHGLADDQAADDSGVWLKNVQDWPTFREMIRTGRPVLIPDITQSDLWRDVRSEDWIHSYLGGPIIASDDQVLGFINLNHNIRGYFNQQHAKKLEAFVAHAAVALENARMFAEIQKRIQEVTALQETSLDTAGMHELDALLDSLVLRTRELFGGSLCGILLYNSNREELEVVAATDARLPKGRRLQLGDGLAGRVAETLEPMVVDDYQSSPFRSQVYDDIPFTSVMAVPMLFSGTLIGVLFVSEIAPDYRPFTEDDLRLLGMMASSAAGAVNSARLLADASRRLLRLDSLRRIDQAISGSFDLRLTIEILLDHVIQQLDIDAAAVLKYQADIQTLEYVSSQGFRRPVSPNTYISFGEGLAGKAAVERKIIRMEDSVEANGRRNQLPEFFAGEKFQAYVAIPLISKGKVNGVLELFHRQPLEIDPEWMEFGEILAGQAAIAIDNISLFNEIQITNRELVQAYDATIEGWAKALELRDMETEGHSRRVVEMAIQLAKSLGVKDEQLIHIRRGAMLHDIGKMGVPDTILQKPGKLTEQEWDIMKQHPIFAETWLSSIRYLQEALDIPASHHEKWDGTGYPRGLKEEEIPLAARIFAIVDVWDALRSDRPYREAWSRDEALTYIREQSGKHFDPRVVEAFLEYIAGKPGW